MSLSPSAVIDGVQKHKEEYEQNPTMGLFGAWDKMWATQKNLAQFFNVDPKHIFLRPNVTLILNDFIMSLKLPAHSEILISDIEYGAIERICQYKAELEGHTLKKVSLHDKGQDPQTIAEEQILQRLNDAITPKTKLVMLSHVMTGSGLVIPVEKIAKLLRSKNIFFAVDGAHGAGALHLDLSNTEIDCYGSNLHKWMMGPKGTGFGYVAPQVREHLIPHWAGWTTGNQDSHHTSFGEGDKWTTRWMICSTFNFADYYGINDTVKFWNDVGPENIWKRHREITNFLATTVSEKTGWTCLSRFPKENQRSPLQAFQLPSSLTKNGFELVPKLLKEKNLMTSMSFIQGEWALRLSANIYNTEDEVVKAAEILASLK